MRGGAGLLGTFAIREGDRAWPLLHTGALCLRIGSPEIKLAIVKQAEFKLATDLGGIGLFEKKRPFFEKKRPPLIFSLIVFRPAAHNSAAISTDAPRPMINRVPYD